MHVLFFGNASNRIAAIRYRIGTFARMLESEGYSCTICLPQSTTEEGHYYGAASRIGKLWLLGKVALRRIAQLRHVPRADVIFFRGKLFPYGPPILERLVCLMNSRVIFDIDDAIWEPPAHVNSIFLRLVDYGWTRKMARCCQHAIVGNETLAEYVRPLNPNVSIVPTCIDMALHREKAYEGTAPVVLGWTGLKDNLGYLEPIEAVLQSLAKEHGVTLHIATGKDYTLDDVVVENETWDAQHEIDYLQKADVGLMPLHDTPRARGKCAFKALQYMAVGTPVVLSPVGMNADVVRDGVDGFHATTPQEWQEKLTRLITDAPLRERMGRAARETVASRYSHDVYYPVLREVLLNVAGEKK
jgi:glycosyltransferase involved in cell wall biosynthesis